MGCAGWRISRRSVLRTRPRAERRRRGRAGEREISGHGRLPAGRTATRRRRRRGGCADGGRRRAVAGEAAAAGAGPAKEGEERQRPAAGKGKDRGAATGGSGRVMCGSVWQHNAQSATAICAARMMSSAFSPGSTAPLRHSHATSFPTLPMLPRSVQSLPPARCSRSAASIHNTQYNSSVQYNRHTPPIGPTAWPNPLPPLTTVPAPPCLGTLQSTGRCGC